jgi:regulator of sigma E protease
MVSEQSRQGLDSVLALTALISINLGLLNLLPIPVLDGGHIIFLTMEMVMRRPVNARLREVTTRIGLAFLLALMLLATYNDIVRNLQ